MSVRPLSGTLVSTGELTFTMMGELDPWGSLRRRLNRLPSEPPRTPLRYKWSRRGGIAYFLDHQWREERRELELALLTPMGRSADASTVAQRMASAAELLRDVTAGLRERDDLRRWACGVGDELRQLSSALGSEYPPTSDGAVLLDAFDRTLRLTAPVDRAATDPADCNRLLRFGYGSPWYVEASVVLGSGTSLTGLLFGLKKICGIDLEIRLKRTELKIELEEARQQLKRLERYDASTRGELEWADRPTEPESGAERAARLSLVERIQGIDFFPWAPKQATLSDED